MIAIPAVTIVAALLVLAAASLALRRWYPLNDRPLVDAIDALLPQTQCAQCGYPGCRPYAEAVASGAATNLCPPGGARTHEALDGLMGTRTQPPEPTASVLAMIDEANCIGCTLCLPPCPVDAIVGAHGQMHTVLARECTGCELCLPACPVDCITLVPAPAASAAPRRAAARGLPGRGCINCGACVPVCPVGLDAHALLKAVARDDRILMAAQGASTCIECGLCDRACPSEIPLAGLFRDAKTSLDAEASAAAASARLRARHAAHDARLAVRERSASERRATRLRSKRDWS